MSMMVKYFLLVLQVCAIASTLVLEGSSGQTISPLASNSVVPPITEARITSNSPGPTSQPNDPPHVESPKEPPPNAGGPITSIPEGSPPSPPVVPPTIPVSVPPIPQPEKGPDSKSPVNPPTMPPPTMPAQIAPPPKDMLENPPPVAQVPTSVSQAPPSVPQAPPTILPGPVASPPNKLPMASPPTNRTFPVPPANLPLPAELPPSTLPSSPPTSPTLPPSPPNLPVPVELPPSTLPSSPPTLPPPPPNLPAPSASPPSTLPTNSPPSPPTLAIPPPNVPAPMASPPNTLPRSSPPTPPMSTIPPPDVPAPMASPPSTLPKSSPPTPPISTMPPPNLPGPMASPPSTLPRGSPPTPPISTIPPPNSPGPVASPPRAPQRDLPPPSPTVAVPPSSLPGPVALPPRNSPGNLPPIQHNSSMPPPNLPVSPVSTPIPSINKGGNSFPVSSPPNRTANSAPPPRSSIKAPIVNHAPPPHPSDESPPTKSHPPPSLPPVYPPPPPGPVSRPTHHRPPPPPGPASNPRHHTPPPPSLDSAVPPVENSVSPSISPFITPPPVETKKPVLPPKVSPSRSPPSILKPIQALPPPPPNEDCLSIVCVDPLTNTPPGTPCKCVLPMQVELRLSISLYTFFPLVSELAFEMASGLYLRSSQVRIMGANEDSQDQEKTMVMINLVPLGEKFDNYTANIAAQRLWLKQVSIKSSLFGDYEVLFVKYPGLPPSPPLPSSDYNGEPYGRGNNGRDVKPLGVDVSKQRHSNKLNSGLIAIIAFSVVVAIVLVGVVVWVLVLKDRTGARSGSNPPATIPPVTKSSGVGASTNGSGPESASLSFRSSIAYTGSAKTFSSSDMEKATDNFNELGVLGEGGFGRVYSGVLEDGTKVAVKVLKRDDQQGGREFLAEVEMLSRLHHRNLVRLIGICTEEKNRCLVYELIPNGSVESHLHGIDKETSPLDWGARLKIALGAARGLAYLHEDSSPRVIHRDFKSSNILLEHDFTPKVSDFGLARTALDEENRHISTRVMGTFGYVAPEYAMTGHLLVKSDVYSYGVVLLELLTGRKPVDMSMPSGQENLVAWARPLLPSHEGLNLLIDPSLSPEVPFDSIAKVAAIASMCVQPEVSHRPFMGEVVQALKLVCNECEETQDLGSRTCSQEDLVSMEFDPRARTDSGPSQSNYPGYESPLDVESGFSGLGLDVDSYRISSSSGPLRPRRRSQIWERMKRFSSGSMSDYGEVLRLLSRSR